jgi:alginate O-acetyltransferase complex protein AlgI
LVAVTSTSPAAWLFRAATWLAVGWFIGWPGVAVLGAAALLTHAAALFGRRLAPDHPASHIVLGVGIAGAVAPLAAVDRFPQHVVPGAVVCVAVFACHAISYLIDARRGTAEPHRHLTALLYLLQFPVLLGGPLSRFGEFQAQLADTDVSMASFSYGVRRMMTGAIKIWLIASPLIGMASEIFALRVTRLSTGAAWLGALCGTLSPYFIMSGLADIGIGAGRIAGLRYQENFRRPYTAESLREFWRRWNITLIAWLRDYLGFPIVGHGVPATTAYLFAVAGFVVIGAWHQWRLRLVIWAVYFATWLAWESRAGATLLARVPRTLRHMYVLFVVTFGWMLLWASGPGPLLGYLEAMIGLSIPGARGAFEYVTFGSVLALAAAILFAGPLVGWISRWRVSVDAATASLLMMLAATAIFLWHFAQLIWRFLMPSPRQSR